MCSAARVIVVEIGEIEALPRCFGFAAFHSPDELKQSAVVLCGGRGVEEQTRVNEAQTEGVRMTIGRREVLVTIDSKSRCEWKLFRSRTNYTYAKRD